jgi:iron complex transport system permease protein
VIGALSVLLVVAAAVCVSIGPVRIDLGEAIAGEAGSVDATILLRTRVPRVLLAVSVGAGLAIAGAVLQALLRNPLAEPHILGVSGGAAFGGVLTLFLAARSPLPPLLLTPVGAFAGALTAMLVVYRLGTVHGRLQPYTFLLAGVVCNAFTGALIMAVNAMADLFQTHGILFWLMGSLATSSYRLVVLSFAYVAVGGWLLGRQARALNALSLGEEGATQLGVDVGRVRRLCFVVTSLLVGAAVAVSGMIGFVGLIVPHVTRLLFGPDHRLLLPASALVGGIFLAFADTLARSVTGASEVPVGVVTALCGGPFFVYLLRRQGAYDFE